MRRSAGWASLLRAVRRGGADLALWGVPVWNLGGGWTGVIGAAGEMSDSRIPGGAEGGSASSPDDVGQDCCSGLARP
eukprot:6865709-Pyramimonas_sp.AAC.1